MTEVTLQQMLQAREDRAALQQSLLQRYQAPLVCFTMNIPGPVKDSPLIRRSFRRGLRLLDAALPQPLHRQVLEQITGCEAVYVLDAPARQLKQICTGIEDGDPMGRLYDMDVLTPEGRKLERDLVGGGSRNCIVCGAPGRGCASRRLHSLDQLAAAVEQILQGQFLEEDSRRMARMARESLLEEVNTTPKPGLVDLRNNGSHRDMDPELFYASAGALEPYFAQCVRIGRETAGEPPRQTLSRLREAGRQAEAEMFRVTAGVNTHKGAIFTLGLLCGSLGRLYTPENPIPEESALLQTLSRLALGILEADLGDLTLPRTAGERLYITRGLTGIRGEAAAGLPAVSGIALPVFREALDRGLDRNRAGIRALMHLIARVEDTNLYHRGGEAGAAWARAEAEALLPDPTRAQVEALDDAFIARNLSPGGCADLLAVTYFLDRLAREKRENERRQRHVKDRRS